MLSTTFIVFSILAVVARTEHLRFPEEFKFGVASASYQIEGAWNVSDKGENIWDRFTHKNPSLIMNGDNGDVACDSYHLWKQDIDLVAKLEVQFYRLSISWPRLLPNGLHNYISEDGKNYYNNLIDGLLEKGIEPVVTLYHWDLPQKLQDLGGWTNPLITEWFAEYARIAYSLYADRVKTWITINEAWIVCDMSYMAGTMAPGVRSTDGGYICNKNVLLAHAAAWRVYDEEFKPKYHGGVSFANHLIWMEPENESEEEIAELLRQFQVGRYSHPIYAKEGGWPPAIEKNLAAISKKEGYRRSKLPAWTKKEIDFVKGTYDFYGMNFYTSRLVRKARPGEQLGPWPTADAPELNARLSFHPDWPHPFPYFGVHPEGIRKQLLWLKDNYGNIPVMITENGVGTLGGLNDTDRIQYYRSYMRQILLAMKEDGVNVTAYTAWTLYDNFEWLDGYQHKFGMYEVDFSSPMRGRTPRASAKYYAAVIRTRDVDAPYNFTIPEYRLTTHPSNKTTFLFASVTLLVTVVIVAVVGWRVRRKRNKRKYQEVRDGELSFNSCTNDLLNGDKSKN